MRIKRLELNGFKSFMAKTVINFDSSITGVVGPNGCGKSNIVDAIIWVMGEQSPKTLRGSSMEDVIFNGSDNKSPSSVCEVSLTLENDGSFPGKFFNFSEITITRRLYRSGESEYLINKVQARLKDIKEIFLDSGARTYAVIEQGEIEKIILSKAQDRRLLIEEAAGISKYKLRKDESSRKLDSTEQNLIRLNDILSELNAQLNTIEKQAKKAKKYKELNDQVMHLETNVVANNCYDIKKDINKTKSYIELEENFKEDINNILSKLELDIEKHKSIKLSVEQRISQLQNTTIELNTQIHKSKSRCEILKSELETLDSRKETTKLEINSLEIRIKRQVSEFDSIDIQVNNQEAVLSEANSRLDKAQSELNNLLQDLDITKKDLENFKTKQVELAQKEIMSENLILSNSQKIENNDLRLDKLIDEKSKQEGELNSLTELGDILVKNINNIDAQKKDSINFIEEKNHHLNSLKDQLRDKEKDKENVKSNFNKVNSRYDALSELQEKFDGLSQGVKSILNSKSDNVKGFIANIINVQKKYEKVLDAVLGSNLETLIIDSNSNIYKFFDDLNNNNLGRASFISLDYSDNKSLYRDNNILNEEGVISLFVDLLTFDDVYKSVINILFRDTYLVNTLENAINLKNKYPDLVFVTSVGEYIDKRGIVTGGSSKALESNIFSQKRELEELKSEKEILFETIKIYDEEINRISSEIDNLDSDIYSKRELISSYSVEEASLSKEHENNIDMINKLNQRISEINFDIDQLRFENSHLEKELEFSKSNKDEIVKEIEKLKILCEEKSKELNFIEERIIPARNYLTECSVEVSTINERFKSVEEKYSFLKEGIENDKLRLKNLYIEVDESIDKFDKYSNEIDNLKSVNKDSIEQLDTINSQVDDLRDLFNLHSNIISQGELDLKDYRLKISNTESVLSTYNKILNENMSELNVLKSRLMDKYSIDIDQLSFDFNKDEDKVISHTQFNFEKLSEEELSQLKNNLDDLNKKLADFGQVNLLAIDEYEKVKTRFEFLNNQKEDIEKSINDLKTAIKKIDETSKERFKKAFDLVNEKFKKFFPILFGGGRATLVMTEPGDYLNTGVDIQAHLPGKKTQNINLFSGGEKALTAISLVFSIFATSPSPFCILDEVDAPLDDANINKFNDAVKALNDKTQFVLITHNKRTMEMVDVLYGITMQEPGISKMVSVRIGDHKDKDIDDFDSYVAKSTYESQSQIQFQ